MTCTEPPFVGAAGERGVAIVSSRGKRRPGTCSVCKTQPGELLCDAPIGAGTCSAPLCKRCTSSPQPGMDLCPKHRRACATPPEKLGETLEASLVQQRHDPALGAPRASRARRQPLERELSWSKSASDKLRTCARSYWSTYIGSWGGWARTAPERARRLYGLKQRRDLASWAGVVVHEVLAEALRREHAGDIVSEESLHQAGAARMERDLASSMRGDWRVTPKAFGLLEHALGQEVTEERLSDARDKVRRCLTAAMRSRVYSAAVMAQELLLVEELTSVPWVDEVPAHVAPDLAFCSRVFTRQLEHELIVVDWKTGRPREHEAEQIAAYRAAGRGIWGWTGPVRGVLVYLDELDPFGRPVELDYPITERDEAVVAERMREDLVQIRSRSEDERDWPMTDNVRACRWCAYRRECGREDAGDVEAT